MQNAPDRGHLWPAREDVGCQLRLRPNTEQVDAVERGAEVGLVSSPGVHLAADRPSHTCGATRDAGHDHGYIDGAGHGTERRGGGSALEGVLLEQAAADDGLLDLAGALADEQ